MDYNGIAPVHHVFFRRLTFFFGERERETYLSQLPILSLSHFSSSLSLSLSLSRARALSFSRKVVSSRRCKYTNWLAAYLYNTNLMLTKWGWFSILNIHLYLCSCACSCRVRTHAHTHARHKHTRRRGGERMAAPAGACLSTEQEGDRAVHLLGYDTTVI